MANLAKLASRHQPLQPVACPAIQSAESKVRPPWVPPNEFAGYATQLALQYDHGTVLVIGANEGKTGTDPSFDTLKSKSAEHLHKVFVEPVPWLFKKLQHNIRDIPRSRALNAAITNTSGWLSMFCFGADAEVGLGTSGKWPEELRKSSRMGSVKRQGREWWSQICSLDRERIFAGVGGDFQRDRALISRFITNTTVRAMTVLELIDAAAGKNRAVRSVQIDVEGVDDVVLKMLPIGRQRSGDAAPFRPVSITFEHNVLTAARTTSATAWLHERGYWTCREGQNIIALAMPS
jgi:FkbM family methyltransferase